MSKVTKLFSHTSGAWSETVKHEVLCCGNIEGNNNKFYSIEIQKNPSGDYRIFTHYGRINSSNIYEERGPFSLGQAESEFSTIVNKKIKGKTVKDPDGTTRREKYERVETIAPTVGSSNVRHVTTKDVATHISASDIIKEKDRFTADVQRLLDQFAQENIHKITSSTSLTFTANGFETALGPVTQSQINQARSALNRIKTNLRDDGTADPDNVEVRQTNNLYLSMIPHPFGRKITVDDWIITDAKLMEEYDLLDQLEASVQMGLTTNTNASKQFANFETDIEPVSAKDKAFKTLVDAVNGSKRHGHLNRWNVKNIYTVKINKERSRFETKENKYGNIQEFFHGSQNANLLSILIGGLIIPPMNAGHVTGRMFGNGIYGADSSTKSLNYSVGGWSGRGNKFSNSFLFRVKFAMGKTYEIGYSTQRPPAGYDSISALSKLGSLMNNEFIVYNLDQCTITHMIELEE